MVANTEETMNYTMTQQYAHTIAFTGDELSNEEAKKRRVSFAPNAHVR